MIKINSLELDDVKRIRAVKLEPSANGLTIIGGRNNQGKTSVLDAIAWALGGDKYRPTGAMREGSAVPPHLKVKLSNGIVVERSGKNSDLKVTDETGKRGGQALLNAFISSFALDLPKFMEAPSKEKASVLLRIIGVGDKLAKYDNEESVLYNRRLEIGRIAEQKEKFAAEMPEYENVPKEVISPSELIRQQQEILARNGENQRISQWDSGVSKTLLVLPTGCGKTIVFAKVTEQCVMRGGRVLILAHRGELLEQAADKIKKATGLGSAVEKAEESCLGSWYRVVVGSVQTLMRDKRLSMFERNHFDTIIIDEAHHCISDSYQNIMGYFSGAKVLGVTATPDRGDMQNLGQVFESLAYEYTLPRAIKEGYLSPIKAVTIPLDLDLRGVSIQAGDFKASDIDSALDPYLFQIADEMKNYCKDRSLIRTIYRRCLRTV